jgi:hypothetical protein
MDKWEYLWYKIIANKFEQLDELGMLGWEAVSFGQIQGQGDIILLKRRLP